MSRQVRRPEKKKLFQLKQQKLLSTSNLTNQISPEKKKHCCLIQGGEPTSWSLYVSKENNLRPDDKIKYIWGLKGQIFIL